LSLSVFAVRLTTIVHRSVIFSGLTTTTVGNLLACEAVQDLAVCGTEDPAYTWTADIKNVTWTAGEKRPRPNGLT